MLTNAKKPTTSGNVHEVIPIQDAQWYTVRNIDVPWAFVIHVSDDTFLFGGDKMSFTRGKLYFSDESVFQLELAIEYTVRYLSAFGITGATITRTIGVWNGGTEYGFELETLTSFEGTTLQSQLEELAESLRSEFHQTSVLVTVEQVTGKLTSVEELNK
jgi:hypothetical protein